MGMGGGGRRRTDGRVGEQSSLPLRVQCKVKARDRGLHHHVYACLNLSIPLSQLLVTCVRACAVSCIALFHVRTQAAAAIFPLNQRLLGSPPGVILSFSRHHDIWPVSSETIQRIAGDAYLES